MNKRKVGKYVRVSKTALMVRKLLPVLPMWFAITIISFLATRCATNSNIMKIILSDNQADQERTPSLIEILRNGLGLDQPIHIHYLRWMGLMKQEDGQFHGVFQGDLEHSIWQ